MFFKFKLLDVFVKQLWLLVYIHCRRVSSSMRSFFHVHHVFQPCSSPEVFSLSPFSPFLLLLVPLPLVFLCFHVSHTRTYPYSNTHAHMPASAHNHTHREMCIIICLSLCLSGLCIYKKPLWSTNETKHICPSVSGLCHLI